MTDSENQYYEENEESESEKDERNQIPIISDIQDGLRELFKNKTDAGLEKENSYDYAQSKTFLNALNYKNWLAIQIGH